MKVSLQNLSGGFQLALPPGKDPRRWIIEHVGLGNMEIYGARSFYFDEGYVLVARTVEDAVKFLDAFPEFKLADGTASPRYSSPYVTQGERRRPHRLSSGPNT